MTREEAIECNKNLKMYMKLSDKNQPCKFLAENYIALDMAIQALEQKPVLDKIRAKIDNAIEFERKWLYDAGYISKDIDIALDAIKSVMAESED